MIITAVVEFEFLIREDLGLDEVQQWLDDYSAYAAGYISGGWGYLETNGDNVRIIKVKKITD